MRILIVGDPHGKLIKKVPKDVDLILITGDLGKTDLARKFYFNNVERVKKGLPEIEEDRKFIRDEFMEIYNSAMKIVKYYSRIAPTYVIRGNAGGAKDSEIRRDNKKWNLKLPMLWKDLKKIKNFYLISNRFVNVNGLRIGALEYFHDVCWVREFKPKNYSDALASAKDETAKAKRILKWFGKNKIDVLLCHQPPYGVLDKVIAKYAPKHWYGKHAGSKAILDFVKKDKNLKYVFCGHMHETRGKKKIGKVEIFNAGVSGEYYVVNIN